MTVSVSFDGFVASQQLNEVPAESTVEDGRVTTGPVHLERMTQLRPEVTEPVFKYVRKLHNGIGTSERGFLRRHIPPCGDA